MRARYLKQLLPSVCVLGLVVLVLAAVGTSAQASDAAACCMRNTTTAYSFINAQGQEPDEKFFTVTSAPPNIMFVLDNSDSMFELQDSAHRLSATERANMPLGCSYGPYDAKISAGGFSMSNSYPPIDPPLDPVNLSEDPGFPDLFRENSFYTDTDPYGCCGNADAWGVMDATHRTLTDACNRSSNSALCQSCVTTKGYFLDPAGTSITPKADVFSGKFLNFYPPKYVLARAALRRMVWNMRNVRIGLATFADENGATMIWRLAPGCDNLFNPSHPDWELQRKRIAYALSRTPFSNWPPVPSWYSPYQRGINFFSDTPLAEALLDMGQYFTANQAVWESWFGTQWYDPEFPNDYTQNNRSVCYACQVNAVVLLTDGEPYRDNCVPQCIKNQDPPCTITKPPTYPNCDSTIYIPRSCRNQYQSQFYTMPSIVPLLKQNNCPTRCGTGDCKTVAASTCCPPGPTGTATESVFYFDAVTRWFQENDLVPDSLPASNAPNSLDPFGRQKLDTHVVAIGVDHPVLENASKNYGGGRYVVANDRQSLEEALNLVVTDVVQKATSFGISSVSALQTSGSLSTLVPRFVPAPSGQPWQGLLYRFKLGSELANGCVPTTGSEPVHPQDINGDRDCNDVFFLDRDGSIVSEHPTLGIFVKDGTITPARPLWEAGRELTFNSPTYAATETAPRRNPDSRVIWTVVDSNNDGRLTSADSMIQFTSANVTQLMPYMNIGNDITNDDACREIYTRLGATDPLTSWGPQCARALIEFYRGRNSLDQDPTKRTQTRDWVLADIFHSSPVTVEPPVVESACSFFPNQCLNSVFTYKGKVDPAASNAWNTFVKNPGYCSPSRPCEQRPSLILVGSNGGFLHAFDAGQPLDGTTREEVTQRLLYNDGTGREVWAFIPPDLVGTLKYKWNKHSYFVDGTAMVRDIWVDSALNPGSKDPSEFRTVAIVGERSGGQHFFALDVTQSVVPTSINPNERRPQFLWLWPQPCDSEAAHVGESWSNYSPKPPPVAPVLFESPSGFTYDFRRYNSGTNSWSRQTTNVEERWVVMLTGGYDRSLVRGRGFAMVDAFTGRTYWSEYFDSAKPMNNRLEYPFTAGAAMLDIGPGEEGNREFFDGYFDAATMGDMGGNLWMARFYEPGQLDSVTGRVTNWGFARAFQQYKNAGTNMKDRRPISYIASNALQSPTSYLRTFFGSGDRASLLAPGGGLCTLDSLYTCAAMGCRVEAVHTLTNAPTGEVEIRTLWSGSVMQSKTVTTRPCVNYACFNPLQDVCMSSCRASTCDPPVNAFAGLEACLNNARTLCPGTCGNTCSQSRVEARVRVENCPSTVTGASALNRWVRMTCTTNSGGNLTCTPEMKRNDVDRVISYTSTTGIQPHRYYGVHTFGGRPNRLFSSPADAEAFDAGRLGDDAPCTGGEANCLVNLGSLSTSSGRVAGSNQSGWFISYDTVDERTASASALTFAQSLESGCVVWNSLKPGQSVFSCSGSNFTQQTRLIQADYITGASNCVAGFGNPSQRFSQNDRATSAPPEPTVTTILPPGGKRISYGLFLETPGGGPRLINTANDFDMVQSLYQLELSPHEHMCRHSTGGNFCAR